MLKWIDVVFVGLHLRFLFSPNYSSYCDESIRGKKCSNKSLSDLPPVQWTSWSAWSGCSACGTVSQTRTRLCNRTCAHDSRTCGPNRNATETEACKNAGCVIDCVWDLKPKTDCSAVCSKSNATVNGTKSFLVKVKTAAANGGKPCPKDKIVTKPCSKTCTGEKLVAEEGMEGKGEAEMDGQHCFISFSFSDDEMRDFCVGSLGFL